MMNNKIKIFSSAVGFVFVASTLSSCWHSKESRGYEYAPNMYYAIAYNPDQPNPSFKDGKTAQNPVKGTIPVGWETFDYANTLEGYEAASAEVKNPLELNEVTLAEGKTLYENMCSHCHGKEGKGDGSIVKLEKFPPPPSYSTGNSSRGGLMKDLTDGKIYHTITYGLNNMGSHASQLSPEERWEITAYVHELQKLQ
jgi:mono/diheme cytochrome c family protein